MAPRHGAPPLRVSEFAGGMINAIGLANPGLDEVRATALPWLAKYHPGTRVMVNVVGNSVDDFVAVVEGLDDTRGVDAFELNVSCPNVKAGGLEFGADANALRALVATVRTRTAKPVFVKLSPTLGAGIVGRSANCCRRGRERIDVGEHDARAGDRCGACTSENWFRYWWRERAGVVAGWTAGDMARESGVARCADHRCGRYLDLARCGAIHACRCVSGCGGNGCIARTRERRSGLRVSSGGGWSIGARRIPALPTTSVIGSLRWAGVSRAWAR